MSEPQYLCKRCEVSRDYDAIGIKLNPLKGGSKTICEPCWNECMSELAGAHTREPSASDFATGKMFKRSGTSSDAAQAASKSAKLNDTHGTIYRLLREKPRNGDQLFNDEMARKDRGEDHVNLSLNGFRARVSELRDHGFVTYTEDRAPTNAGGTAAIARITTPEERQEAA